MLSAAEIRILWKACEAHPAGRGVGRSFSRAVRFILLTALREGEAGNIRYRDVIDGRLTIPDTKGGKPHSLRLPPLALELLGQGEPNALAFPGKNGALMSWPTHLDKLRRANPQITEHWHIHDLRRSCATHLQRLDVRPDVVEAVLGHALPGISVSAPSTCAASWSSRRPTRCACGRTKFSASSARRPSRRSGPCHERRPVDTEEAAILHVVRALNARMFIARKRAGVCGRRGGDRRFDGEGYLLIDPESWLWTFKGEVLFARVDLQWRVSAHRRGEGGNPDA